MSGFYWERHPDGPFATLDDGTRDPQRKCVLVAQVCTVFAERAAVCARRQIERDRPLLEDNRVDRRQDLRQGYLSGLETLTDALDAASMGDPELVQGEVVWHDGLRSQVLVRFDVRYYQQRSVAQAIEDHVGVPMDAHLDATSQAGRTSPSGIPDERGFIGHNRIVSGCRCLAQRPRRRVGHHPNR